MSEGKDLGKRSALRGFDFSVPLTPAKRGIDTHGVADFPVDASKFFVGSSKRASILSLCYHHNPKGAKFVTRIVVEEGVKGIRVWRIL